MNQAHEHAGWQLIRSAHETLKIDEEWTEWHDDGFTWWSHAHAQRFRFEGPHDVDGTPTYWASFEIELLRNVPSDNKIAKEIVAADNRAGNLFEAAIVDGRIVYRGRTYALQETAVARGRLLADRAIIANVLAHRRAAGLAEIMHRGFDGLEATEAAISAHPVNGPRSVPDDLLDVLDGVHVPHGRQPAPPPGAPDLAKLATFAQNLRSTARLSDDELTLDLAIREGAETFDLKLDYRAKHPILGSGLLALLTLPRRLFSSTATGAELAERLNSGEWVAASARMAEAA